MGAAYSNASGLPEQPGLAVVPFTRSLAVTPTYLNQIPPGYQAAAELASADRVVAALMPKLSSQLNTRVEEKQIELKLQIEALEAKVSELSSSIGRARLFLDYARNTSHVGGALHSFSGTLEEKARTGSSLSSKDLTPLVESVYNALRRNHGATSAYKERIRQYIASGEAGDETLHFLAVAFTQAGKPVLNELLEYRGKLKQLQNSNSRSLDTALRETEEALTQAVVAIKSGMASPAAVEMDGLRMDVYQTLQQMIGVSGVRPERQFLCGIEHLVEAQSGGAVAPFHFKAAAGINCIPDQLKPAYLPVERFGQIITLFDEVLDKTVVVYARRNEKIQALGKAMISKTGKGLLSDLLRRGLLEENSATLALYPDGRVLVPNAEDLSRKIIELVRQGIPEARRIGAEYFGVPEEEFRLEELAKLQSQIMQVLPLQVYVCADIRSRFGEPMQEVKKHKRHYMQPKWIMLLAKYESNEKQLQRDFNVTIERLFRFTDSTAGEALSLFGQEFSFVRQVLAKKAAE
ncbi:hypothetical protein HYV85_00485 [Candidatus Woesearchaeota archaeon]|nr:hypothetical protein [Candidatus Woesearchaeota archaeon]